MVAVFVQESAAHETIMEARARLELAPNVRRSWIQKVTSWSQVWCGSSGVRDQTVGLLSLSLSLLVSALLVGEEGACEVIRDWAIDWLW